MITMYELIHGAEFDSLPLKHQYNLEVLLDRLMALEADLKELNYSFTFKVNSGYRTKEHHIKVYQDLAEHRGVPFDESKIPWGSQHLTGCAADIADDKNFELWKTCHARQHLLEKHMLWCEDLDDQHRVHFQINPPRSGARFFKP